MPIYAFACGSCGHRFERLQKLSAPDPDTCPQCGAQTVSRQVSAPAFRLAGGGWYETDFKKAGEGRHNLAGEAGKPKPADTPTPAPAPAAASDAKS